jgi:putative spermidine/putrescine transport system substrate-binding protein
MSRYTSRLLPLLVLVFVIGCSSGGAPPASAPTTAGAPTTAPAAKPTTPPAPTAAPTSAPAPTVAPTAPAPTVAPAAAQITLTWASAGGAYGKAETSAWLDPYMNEHPNVKILYDDTMDPQKLIQMVNAGNVSWDVATLGNDFGLESTAKYLEKIDCAVVPCSMLQPEKYPTTGYRAPQSSSGTVMGWNTDKIGSQPPPSTWADFFDLDKYPGKRIMMADLASSPLEIALVADGVPPNQVYPVDIPRALKKMESIRDQTTFTTNYQGCAEAVATGDAVMGQCWSGRMAGVIKNGAHVKYTWKGQTASAGYMAVPKGGKNVQEAMKLIGYVLDAKNCARITDFIAYGCVNKDSAKYYKPEVVPNLGVANQDESSIYIDDKYYDAHRDDYNKAWQTWLNS